MFVFFVCLENVGVTSNVEFGLCVFTGKGRTNLECALPPQKWRLWSLTENYNHCNDSQSYCWTKDSKPWQAGKVSESPSCSVALCSNNLKCQREKSVFVNEWLKLQLPTGLKFMERGQQLNHVQETGTTSILVWGRMSLTGAYGATHSNDYPANLSLALTPKSASPHVLSPDLKTCNPTKFRDVWRKKMQIFWFDYFFFKKEHVIRSLFASWHIL